MAKKGRDRTGTAAIRLSDANYHRDELCRLPHYSSSRDRAPLLIQIVFFQEFGPEILWRSGNVWSTLWRKVHEIPIRPHRVDMIRRQFSSPEMENLSILPPKYMHHRPLHIIRVSLAFVIGLIGRVGSGNKRYLRPSTLSGPRIDSIGRGFGNCDKRGTALSDLVPGAIKPIDQRRTGRTGIVPVRTVHKRVKQQGVFVRK